MGLLRIEILHMVQVLKHQLDDFEISDCCPKSNALRVVFLGWEVEAGCVEGWVGCVWMVRISGELERWLELGSNTMGWDAFYGRLGSMEIWQIN